MRGSEQTSGSLFSHVDLEERIPAKHPLRVMKALVDDVLVALIPSPGGFTWARAVSRSCRSG